MPYVWGNIINIAILIALLMTFAVLICGVVIMAKSGTVNKKYGNIMMRLRVIAQLFAIILIFLAFYINS